LEPHEVLELILGLAIRRGDVKPLAKNLLARFGGFAAVLDASPQDLLAVPGIGPGVVGTFRTLKAGCAAYLQDRASRGDVLSNPDLVADYCRMRFAGEPTESFAVLLLDARNRVMATRILGRGTVNGAAVYPREIASEALSRKAVSVILAHNHPSGNPEPSAEDRRVTSDIRRALDTLGVKMLDHVIVGREGVYSFREHGEIQG
jgi:DNA repair protein RadC